MKVTIAPVGESLMERILRGDKPADLPATAPDERIVSWSAGELGMNLIERVLEPIGHLVELAAYLRVGAARGRGRRE